MDDDIALEGRAVGVDARRMVPVSGKVKQAKTNTGVLHCVQDDGVENLR